MPGRRSLLLSLSSTRGQSEVREKCTGSSNSGAKH